MNLHHLDGSLDNKIDLCIRERIKKQDADYLIEPLRHRTKNRLWQTEFWGKWILSAIAAYEYTHDPECKKNSLNAIFKNVCH